MNKAQGWSGGIPQGKQNSAGWPEFLACAALLTVVTLWSMWPVFAAPLDRFPAASDAMGHLAKLRYLAESLRQWQWPSWFPYWYSGATVIQYYPPLSYLLLLPVQMIFNNPMVTFKFFLFATQLTGGLGAWFFCHRFLGPRVGLWGALLYSLQPFLLRSLLVSGLFSQGAVFAFTPWFFTLTMLLLERRTFLRWALVCGTAALLILSHPMHAFLVATGTGIFVLALAGLRKIKFFQALDWAAAIVLGAGLISFWWVPGVTQLETPGIPFLLPEAAANYAASLAWFNPAGRRFTWYYFGLTILLLAIFSLPWLLKRRRSHPLGAALGASFIFTVIVSFGQKLPFFQGLPMAQSVTAGRMLSFSALVAVILGAYLVRELFSRKDMLSHRLLAPGIFFAATALLIFDAFPYAMPMGTETYTVLQRQAGSIPVKGLPFDEGRFTWLTPENSAIAYFTMLKGLNSGNGWNIEGTPHNRPLWRHGVAIPANQSGYVVRNLLQWNTRSVLVEDSHQDLQRALQEAGFNSVGNNSGKTLFFNPVPSSYFLRPEQNGIAIGRAAPGLVMNFPWLVQGKSPFLEDYPPEDLQKYRLIYLIEPRVKDMARFQQLAAGLAETGKTVVVEFGRSELWPLYNTYPYWEKIPPAASLVPTPGSPFTKSLELNPDPRGQAPVIGNMNGVLLEMVVKDVRAPALGYINAGNSRIYFVGLALGQQLNAPGGDKIRAVLEQLMDLASPNKNIVPPPFPVVDAQWSHTGVKFTYETDRPGPVWISVTYTPRWKAEVDGKPVKVQELENLILMDLPPGRHLVTLRYSRSWVEWLGAGLSLLSLGMVLWVCRRYYHLAAYWSLAGARLKKTLEELGG